MPLIVLAGAVLLLLYLIARLRWNAFLALLVTAFSVALANKLGPAAALASILKGIGDTMGSLVLILVFGAMLGKLIEESGAAHSITRAFTRHFGLHRIQLSILVTGFLVGLPMVYNASFLVLIPLVYTLSTTTGLPLMHLGIPLSSALSVAHGYLPPHPAPVSIAILYHADVGRTLLYGLVLAVPAIILAGPVLAGRFRHLRNLPPKELHQQTGFSDDQLPGLTVSLLSILLPVLLIAGGSVFPAIRFLGDPNVALFLAVMAGLYLLGLRRGRTFETLMESAAAAAASVSMVILIIAAGGAFKQVLLDSGTADAVKAITAQMGLSPLLLAWSTAALVRLAVGSATVAAITAAGIVAPLVPASNIAPELLVIATTAGSLMFSHFNDIGFWMFKQYYNVTVKQTFQIWTVMESIVAIVGLIGVYLLSLVVPSPAGQAKRAYFLNSYHQGYPSSDESMAAAVAGLKSAGVQVRVGFLDAKRHPGESELGPRAAGQLSAIREFRPDLLIACDDDAVKYVLAPHFRSGPTPAVFCGVNWSAAQYGLPSSNVTGILEVVPVEQTLRVIRDAYPQVRSLLVLSEDSVSERNNRTLLDARYRAIGFEPGYVLVTHFEDWKREFQRAQDTSDVIYLPTNGAIREWDAAAARAWVAAHMRRPVVTCDDFMMPYAAFGLTKVAREQGEWAAASALRILRGERPESIPVASNRQTRCFVNPALARKVRFSVPSELGCEEVPGPPPEPGAAR